MRRFFLERLEDVTGLSGIGIIAEGAFFTDDTVILKWLGTHSSIAIWKSLDDMLDVHGHNGKTVVKWIDHEHVKMHPGQLFGADNFDDVTEPKWPT